MWRMPESVGGRLLAWLSGQEGQDMIEYALVAGLISVAIVVLAAVGLPEAFAAWATDVAGAITG